jgi:DNA-binding transcriptional LysR family regulator
MAEVHEIEVFTKVAEQKSFTIAAYQLGLSKAAVSKSITRLEKSLGTRLLQRTTRRLSLTEAGHRYYQHSQRALTELEIGKKAILSLKATPSGHLKITAPVTFGKLHVATLIPDFMRTFDQVTVDLVLTDRLVNLAAEGFDLAIRLSAHPGLNLVAKKLAPTKRILCASPLYLEQNGTPKTPGDLKSHQCLSYLHFSNKQAWQFRGPRGIVKAEANGRFQINNIEAIQAAALSGCGIALMPTYIVGPELSTGRLVQILSEYEPISKFGSHVVAAFHPDRHLLPKVRVFIEHLQKSYGRIPYWESRSFS